MAGEGSGKRGRWSHKEGRDRPLPSLPRTQPQSSCATMQGTRGMGGGGAGPVGTPHERTEEGHRGTSTRGSLSTVGQRPPWEAAGRVYVWDSLNLQLFTYSLDKKDLNEL